MMRTLERDLETTSTMNTAVMRRIMSMTMGLILKRIGLRLSTGPSKVGELFHKYFTLHEQRFYSPSLQLQQQQQWGSPSQKREDAG